MMCRFCISEFLFDDLVGRKRDLVRRWTAPAEQGTAIRLRWLTDSLRKGFTKLAADVSRQYGAPKPQAK
jgi:hypothetical protein